MSKFKRYERYKDSGVEWIGEIPEHWEITKLKYICSESAVYGLNESAENYVEEGVRFIRTTDIDNKGNLDNSMGGVFLPEEKVKGYILKTGDLLVSRSGSLGTSLYFDEDKYGKCSYAGYLVKFRANSKNCPKFLFYFSKSNIFYIQIQLALVSSTISNFNGNKYANMILPLPSYYEQKAISNFLDQKTAEIDSLIADKEKLIELLQEKRQAVITEAVTKGLNPNVKMKDSGIEWIGEIPEHWEVCGFTKYISSIIDYRGKTPEKVDEGVFLVTAKNIKNGRIDYSLSQEYVKSEEYEQIMRRGLPEIGDVVFTTEAPLGEVANVDRTDVAFAQRVIKFRGKVEKLDNYYLKYWIMSHGFQHDLQSYATGSTATGIKASKLSKLIILLPRLEEQKAIVNFLDQKTAEIDDLIFDIYTQIQKLKEYRQSLISEAVTGKIDVRDYVVSN
jgi:type I restriction enzyme S subunit